MLSHYGLAVNLAVGLVLTLHQFILTGSGHLRMESCQAAVLRTLTECAATRTLPLFDNHRTHVPLAQELEKHVMNEIWAHPTLCSSTFPCEFSSHPHPVYWCSILLPGLCFSHNSEIQKILKEKTWKLWYWLTWYQRWPTTDMNIHLFSRNRNVLVNLSSGLTLCELYFYVIWKISDSKTQMGSKVPERGTVNLYFWKYN